ncbi:hypothetical protein DOTSEDRAFT_22865 [Dothistroma septosporum NZE10]|uniref:Uncharacterized protein n=1 Tax=Dothistroma septosporum (strain NZE10 / CBS 128990) TaxID=675120 RepID=N1PX92_DOTSN|nr:hypothetical protein DOTSEDRAFT_22865 [Dothistroma septosporum NZE10]
MSRHFTPIDLVAQHFTPRVCLSTHLSALRFPGELEVICHDNEENDIIGEELAVYVEGLANVPQTAAPLFWQAATVQANFTDTASRDMRPISEVAALSRTAASLVRRKAEQAAARALKAMPVLSPARHEDNANNIKDRSTSILRKFTFTTPSFIALNEFL